MDVYYIQARNSEQLSFSYNLLENSRLRPAVFVFRRILEVCLVYIRPSFHQKVSLSLSRKRQRARYHIISREQSAAVGCFRVFYSYVKMV